MPASSSGQVMAGFRFSVRRRCSALPCGIRSRSRRLFTCAGDVLVVTTHVLLSPCLSELCMESASFGVCQD
eukprot:883962-Alexandrium_andersonii.AAC.1